MKRILLIVCAVCIGLMQSACAEDYQYVSAKALKGMFETSQEFLLVDIQEEKDFAAHHITGSLETNAYPVKSDVDRQALEQALQQAKNHESVVVVCPRGQGGARRTYDYLKEQGVPEAKLAILTGGMSKWPYPELTATE